jgi:hypothetical protein
MGGNRLNLIAALRSFGLIELIQSIGKIYLDVTIAHKKERLILCQLD